VAERAPIWTPPSRPRAEPPKAATAPTVQVCITERRRRPLAPAIFPRELTWGLALLVAVAGFCLGAYRHQLAPDLHTDEVGFFLISRAIALGQGMVSPGTNAPYFWDPPLFLLIDALVMKLLGLAGKDIFTAIYTLRLINITVGALTAGLLFVLGTRLRGPLTGLFMSALLLLDPFSLRNTRRGMLEPLVMLLLVMAILLIQRYSGGLSERAAAALGILFGLMLLAKELGFFLLAVPLVFYVLGRPPRYRQALARVGTSWLVALGVYSLYPLWAVATGAGGDFFSRKGSQLARLTGQVPHPGGYHDSAHPSLASAALENLSRYGTSYFVMGLGAVVALYLLVYCRGDVGARLLGSLAAVNVCFFTALFLKGGALGDQYFYMLLVSMAATLGYGIPVLAQWLTGAALPWAKGVAVNGARASTGGFSSVALARQPWGFRGRLSLFAWISRAVAALALLGVSGVFAYNVRLYDAYDAQGVDDGYQQMAAYLADHVVPGTTLAVDDTSSYTALFPRYSITLLQSLAQFEGGQPLHYVLVSSKVSSFGAVPPSLYRWVQSSGQELFAVDEDSFGHIALYYVG